MRIGVDHHCEGTEPRRQAHFAASFALAGARAASALIDLVLSLTAGAPEAPGDEPADIGVVLGVEGPNIVLKRILPDKPAVAQKAIHVGDKIMAATEP